MQNLVIVESPTKARTLSKFLGSKYQIEASMGHVRDLPKGEMGIDLEHNFEPRYIVPRDKTRMVNELKKTLSQAKTLWLATDPDREGEAIAWHLKELLTSNDSKSKIKNSKFKIDFKRVVFHEITPEAVKEAFANPREINYQLVDAQQARRILDRIVGYKLSPLLWKKVKSGLSAGRVQSVTLRLIVEKEEEIKKFKAEEYWTIKADFLLSSPKDEHLLALVIELDGKKLAIASQKETEEHLKNLQEASYQVQSVIQKEVRKYAPPPFTTSTLQQAASLKLGLTAKKTMMVAQALYEHGVITYMRTDSVNLSAAALKEVRTYISDNLGKAYLPDQPKFYKAKSKLAQEAHEAIRPTKIKISSLELKKIPGLTRDHYRLYDLIWKRTMACQVNEAVMDQTTIDITAKNREFLYLLRTTGSQIKFDGWLKVYGISQKTKDEEEEEELGEKVLPALSENEELKLAELLPEQHFTEAPARFNEASLIKKLEELGIGRPSTYAPIISTILERYYVEKRERRFFPTELGIAVNKFLMTYFADILDYAFTAQMEDELDEVAQGQRRWQVIMEEFYSPFEEKIIRTEEKAERIKIEGEKIDKKCPQCGKDLMIRFGKFGKFLACSGFPECKYTESFEEKVDARCPDCGGEIVLRRTRRGKPFYGCKNWPTCKFASWTKPKSTDESPEKTKNS